MKDDFFTMNELAKHFWVNPKAIYRRLWAKEIPAYKVGRCLEERIKVDRIASG